MDSQPNIWQRSFSQPTLKDDEIHIWRVLLKSDSATLETSFENLSPDELQRAERYYFKKDRNHFMVARGILRKILSSYLDICPKQIRFSYNDFGKPMVSSVVNNKLVFFNISHSQNLALVAVTSKQEIGVDIEALNKNIDVLKVADYFFSPTEIQGLKTLSPALRVPFFFKIWTRKEALIKAFGKGLLLLSKQFTIPVTAENIKILKFTKGFSKTLCWSSMILPSEQKYISALAVEGKIKKVLYWQY